MNPLRRLIDCRFVACFEAARGEPVARRVSVICAVVGLHGNVCGSLLGNWFGFCSHQIVAACAVCGASFGHGLSFGRLLNSVVGVAVNDLKSTFQSFELN